MIKNDINHGCLIEAGAIGVTGSVAAGKSTVTQGLATLLGCGWFSSDQEVHRLLADDPGVASELERAFGPEILDSNQKVDRAVLRELVFKDKERRTLLEQILHPKVRAAWKQELKKNRSRLVEIPLLFETRAERSFTTVIVVGCSWNVSLQRITEGRRVPRTTAESILRAQMPLQEKMSRADLVIWNDGSNALLQSQLDLAAQIIIERHGRN